MRWNVTEAIKGLKFVHKSDSKDTKSMFWHHFSVKNNLLYLKKNILKHSQGIK